MTNNPFSTATQQLITPARHLFLAEQGARVEVHHQGDVWQAEAVDVSKNHFSISCQQCTPLLNNELIDLVKVTLFEQAFEFTQLTLIKREDNNKSKKTRLVLRNE